MPLKLIPAWRVWQIFLDKVFPFWRRQHRRKPLRPTYRPQPFLEMLEARLAPAVYNVPTGTDPGINVNSLNTAILLADTNSDISNIINLAPGTYTAINQAIVAASTKTLTIVGQDQGVTITADQQNRVFTIDANVVFENLTITGGKVQEPAGPNPALAEGGGLLIDGGTVTLSNVNLTGNSARGGDGSNATIPGGRGHYGGEALGGGIYLGSGVLNLNDTTIAHNQVMGGKGGEGSPGNGELGTSIGGGGGGGEAVGGGIFVSDGVLTVYGQSVFQANNALGGSGGAGANGHSGANGVKGGPGKPGTTGGPGGVGGDAYGGGLAMGGGTGSQVNFMGGGTGNLFNANFSSNSAVGGPGGNGAMGGKGGSGANGEVGVGRTLPDGVYGTGLGGNGGVGGQGGRGGPGGTGYGGGCYIRGATLSLVSSSFQANLAKGGIGGQGGSGASGGQAGAGANGRFMSTEPLAFSSDGNGGKGGTGGEGGRGGFGGGGYGGGLLLYGAKVELFAVSITNSFALGAEAGNGGKGGPGANGGLGGEYENVVTDGQTVGSSSHYTSKDFVGKNGGTMGYGGAGGFGGYGGNGYGGGIYMLDGSLLLVGGNLSDNIAQGGMGGIGGPEGKGGVGGPGHDSPGSGTSTSHLTITGSGTSPSHLTIIGDGGNGGSGYAARGSLGQGQGGGGGNGGSGNGGGIYIEAGSCSIVNSNLLSDNAEGSTGGAGGIAAQEGSTGGSGGSGRSVGGGGGKGGMGGHGGNGGAGGAGLGGGIYLNDGVIFGETFLIASTISGGQAFGGAGGPGGSGGNGGSGGLGGNGMISGGRGGWGGSGGNGGSGGSGGNGGNGSGGAVYVGNGTPIFISESSMDGFVQAGKAGTGGQAGNGGMPGLAGSPNGPASQKAGMNGGAGQPGTSGQSQGDGLKGEEQPIEDQATHLVISPILPTVFADTEFQDPVYVVAEDANGNVDPYFNGAVSIGMGNNPDDAMLDGPSQDTGANGTLQTQASLGVAVFSSLDVSKDGTGDTLLATTSGASQGTTNSFDAESPYQIIFYAEGRVVSDETGHFNLSGHGFVQLISNVDPGKGNYNQVYGLHPAGNIFSSPGIIESDNLHPWDWRISFPVTFDQYRLAADFIYNQVRQPDYYDLLSRDGVGENCVSWISQLADTVGLQLPNFVDVFGAPDPNTLANSLAQIGDEGMFDGGTVQENLQGTLPNNNPDPPPVVPDQGSVLGLLQAGLQNPGLLAQTINLAFQQETLDPVNVGVGQSLAVSFSNVDLNNALAAIDFGNGALIEESLTTSYTFESTGTQQVMAIVINSGAVDEFLLEVNILATGGQGIVSFVVPNPPPTIPLPLQPTPPDVVLPTQVISVSQSTGPVAGGTDVTITGTNLSPATAVYFGSTPVTTFINDSDSQIEVDSPPGTPGTVDISVVTPFGTSPLTPTDQFTYGSGAAPAVSSVSPSAGPLTGGTMVSILGANFAGSTPPIVDFDGNQGTVLSYSTSQIVAVSPSGTSGISDVHVTASGGTSIVSSEDQFTYVPTPTVTGLVTASGLPSGGTTVTINGTGLADATAVTFGTNSATIVSDTDTQLIVLTPPSSLGIVDVTVTTPGGTSVTSSADQFTYVPPPIVSNISPAGGPVAGGTTVTIQGTGLANATAVNFGSIPATIVSDSDSEIVATSPPGAAGAVDVTVVTVRGTSLTSAADQFTYEPAPTVTAINPVDGPAMGGSYVTITGTNLAGATAVYFGATAASYFFIGSDSEIVASSPPGTTGTVDVTVQTTSGTSVTSSADQFTYLAAPTVSSLSSSTGPTAGGTSMTITGSGFTGATDVDFGSTQVTNFVINSDSQITVTSPEGTAGTVDVTVQATGGISATSPADEFTYGPGAVPTVNSISPAAGPLAGGTTVTITGTNFAGSTAPIVDFGTNPGTVTSFSTTQIVAISPAGVEGTVDVTVTATGGTSATSTGDQFTYQALPSITSITPAMGPVTGNTPVTITGTDLLNPTAVYFGSTPASSFYSESDTQVVAYSPVGTVGSVDVTVTTSSGISPTSAADEFTYGTFAAAPTVTTVSPGSGSVAGGTPVTITGTNLGNATTVFFGTTPVTTFSSDTDGQIEVVSPPGIQGSVDVTVVTPGGASATLSADMFTYVLPELPTVTGITPSGGTSDGGTWVLITGTNLANATAVNFGSNIGTIEEDLGNQLLAMSPAGSEGTVDVTVTTAGGTSATSTVDQFTYAPVPALTGISPSTGPVAGGTQVTITGSNLDNAIGVEFGSTIVTDFISNTTGQIVVDCPSTDTAGIENVTVLTPGGASASLNFTYTTATTSTSISPSASNANPSIYGQSLSFTATVSNTSSSGTPTGNVSFYNGSTLFATVALSDGSATFTTSSLDAGTYAITATFNGSTDFASSSSDPTMPLSQTINPASTTTTITASSSNPNPADFGQALSFTATVANTSGTGQTPTGWVSFYNGATKLVTLSLVAGSATYTNSTLHSGTYSLTATYTPTTDFVNSVSDPTEPVQQTINPDSTATTLSASSSNPSPSRYGQSLSFTATVANTSGTGQTPTGSVSFYNGSTKLVTISLVAGSATYTTSALHSGSYSLTATYNGTNDFTTSSSDPTNPVLQTINADSTSTSIAASSSNPSPSTYGQSLSFTATVANLSTGVTPTGSVSFYNGSTKLVTISLVAGSATYTTSALHAGSYSLTATYNGTNDFITSSSDPTNPVLQTINAAGTMTTISASSSNPSPASYGQSLSYTATVANSSTSATPTGTVSFYNGATKLATLSLVSGTATYTTSALLVGTYSLTAKYNGTIDFDTSASDLTTPVLQTINPDSTSTNVAAASNPAVFGQAITFTATVTNTVVAGITPTGKATFQDVFNGVTTNLGAYNLVNGVATVTTSALAAGSHAITATYSGAADFSTSGGTLPGGEIVNPASTTIAVQSSLSLSSFGQKVTYTATVTPGSGTFDNRGTVQFQVDGNNFGGPVALSSGTASIQESTLAVGSHTITATYSGDTDFSGSTTTTAVAQTIDADTTSTSITASSSNSSPSLYGQSLSFTATVANTSGTSLTPSGTVSFYNGSTKLATFNLNAAGSATYTTSTLSAGTYSLTATYNGTTDFATSSSATPVLQTIEADGTATTITASSSNPNPSTYGQSLSFTATVANTSGTSLTPTGSVSFYNGSTKLITINLVAGSATYTTSALNAGAYSLTATYNGTTDFATSSSDPTTPILQTVDADSTSTSITASSSNSNPATYGQSLSFTATVANTSGTGLTPTGSVSFYNGATKLITISLVSGSATYTTSTLHAGSYSLTAIYNGTTDFTTSASDPTTPVVQTINATNTTTTLTAATSNPSPSTYGQSLSFTATVANSSTSATPTGTVSFYNGATKLATLNLVAGSATYTTSTLLAGSYSLTATFNGTSDFNTSASDPTTPVLQTITAASTSTSVQSSVDPATVGESITFTATVTNSAGTGTTPTGTVTFQDTLNGVTTTLGTVNVTNGVATFTTSGLASGSHTIAAVFNPSIDFVTSSESLDETVS